MSALPELTSVMRGSPGDCHSMIHDKKIIGVCGETELANAKQSLVTMAQVSCCD